MGFIRVTVLDEYKNVAETGKRRGEATEVRNRATFREGVLNTDHILDILDGGVLRDDVGAFDFHTVIVQRVVGDELEVNATVAEIHKGIVICNLPANYDDIEGEQRPPSSADMIVVPEHREPIPHEAE